MPDSPFFRYAKSEGRLSDCYCVMVIKTIGRLFSRKVLIVPQAVKTTDWLNRILKINISKKKLKPVRILIQINLFPFRRK